MKKLTIFSVAASMLVLLQANPAAAIPNRPAGARIFMGEFVKHYNQCVSPNDWTFLSMQPACSPPQESVPACRFDTNGKGKIRILADTANGDLVYKIKFKGLTASCEGEQLDFILKYRQTNDDCTGGDCTALDTETIGGSCVVAGGRCNILSTFNSNAVTPVFQSGLETSLEFHGCGMKHNGEVAFTCGLLLD